MADRKYLDIIRTWAPIVLEPIAKRAGLTKAVDAFAAAAGRQADALALFQKRADRRARPGAEAILLRPDRSPVPFAGRDQEVKEFEDWMFSDGWMKWRLLTGPSGRGKTRLMMGVVDHLNEIKDRPVHAGFLDLDSMERNPGAIAGFAGIDGVKGDLLLVLDYAERARQSVVSVLKLALMLEKLAEAGTERRVRVVLIARGRSEVWEEIGRQHPDIQEMLMAEGLELAELPPLAPTVSDRLAEFDRAYAAFDRYFRDVDRGELPPASWRPDLSVGNGRDDYADAVMIHLAALAVHQRAVSPADMSAERLLRWIIDRERGEWSKRATSAGIATDITSKAMAEAVGIATLTALSDSAPDGSRLVQLIGVCPLLADLPAARRAQVADILHDLYPGSGHAAGVAPDLIGTWFLGQLEPAFYQTVFSFLKDREIVTGLTKLNWLAQSWSTEDGSWNQVGADRICAAINASPERVLPLIILVAQQSGDPIGQVAAKWLETHKSTDLARSIEKNQFVPHHTTALREFAVVVEEILLDSLCDNQSDETIVVRAQRLNGLSTRLSALGKREEALSTIDESVSLLRNTSIENPERIVNLAESLNYLSLRLADLGKREAALNSILEAITIWRTLIVEQGSKFHPQLAHALNNLSRRLAAVGHREDALSAIEEAIAIRRRLVAQEPKEFSSDLATSLNNFATRLAALDRREEALTAMKEAVDLRRDLAATWPDSFNPSLASALNNLGIRLADLGRREEALDAIQEAVALRRNLAMWRPDAFNPSLAESLSNLAVRLGALGRHHDALDAIEKAVALRRNLASKRPDAFNPGLAIALNNLSVRLATVGRHKEALAAIQEAVSIRRTLSDARPDVFQPGLALSLANLSARLAAVDRPHDALREIKIAVNIYRNIAKSRPILFRSRLSNSLSHLSARFSDLGQTRNALGAIEEAVQLRRRLADERPTTFRPYLATSLNDLSHCLLTVDRKEDALLAISEAIAIRRDLAEKQPDAFRPDLATSLGVCGTVLSALKCHDSAAEHFREGLAQLAPYLRHRPEVLMPLGVTMRRDYLQSCGEASCAPDRVLLASIDEILGPSDEQASSTSP